MNERKEKTWFQIYSTLPVEAAPKGIQIKVVFQVNRDSSTKSYQSLSRPCCTQNFTSLGVHINIFGICGILMFFLRNWWNAFMTYDRTVNIGISIKVLKHQSYLEKRENRR